MKRKSPTRHKVISKKGKIFYRGKGIKLSVPKSLERQAMEKAVAENYASAEQLNYTGKLINDGYCDFYATLLQKKLKGSELMDTENIDPGTFDNLKPFPTNGHVWVKYKGKHYDAECKRGVTNFLDLPYFKRLR